MEFSVKTILSLLFIVDLFVVLFFLIFRTQLKHKKVSLDAFILAKILQSLAIFFFIILKDVFGNTWQIILSNLPAFFGIAIEVFAFVSVGQKHLKKIFIPLISLATLLSIIFILNVNSPHNIRIFMVFLLYSILFFYAGIKLFKNKPKSKVRITAGIFMCLIALTITYRFFDGIIFNPQTQLLDKSLSEMFVFTNYFLISFVLSLNFVFLLKEESENLAVENENRYRTIFEEAVNPVMLIKNDRFVHCNKATLKALKLKTLKQFINVFPGEISPEIQPDGKMSKIKDKEMISRAMENGFHTFEWVHKDSNNENTWYNVSLTKIQISGETYLYVVWNDINQKKIAENKLKELNLLKDKLFSIIAHDLSSPIINIVRHTEYLANDIENSSAEEIKMTTDFINNAAKQVQELITNLLQWSKSQLKGVVVKKETQLVLPFINNLLVPYIEKANFKSIKINNTIDKELVAIFDSNIIEIVIRNLVSNAIKFTPLGGNITISFVKSTIKNSGMFSISDNGTGMSETQLNNLFKLGIESSTNGTNNELGSGLGLILCKDFLITHGCDLIVSSVEGKGTEMQFELQLKERALN